MKLLEPMYVTFSVEFAVAIEEERLLIE